MYPEARRPGLGDVAGAVEIAIHWPDGSVETLPKIQPDRLVEFSYNALYKNKKGESPCRANLF